MRSAVVVELDPVAQHAHRILQAFEAMAVRALLFHGADQSFHHAVLLRAMRRDELLVETIAAHQAGVAFAGEHQAVVRSQQERHRHPA